MIIFYVPFWAPTTTVIGISFIMWIVFGLDFVLCSCENGLYGCGLISYADLLLNTTNGMFLDVG